MSEYKKTRKAWEQNRDLPSKGGLKRTINKIERSKLKLEAAKQIHEELEDLKK